MKSLVLCLSFLLSLGCVASLVSLPEHFDVIGPFPGGMREVLGDTLEAFGGIFNIPRADDTMYPSELGPGGEVSWTTAACSNGNIRASFNYWERSFLQGPYGWAILLWQGYAIGDFEVSETGNYLIQLKVSKEFWIDGPDGYHGHGDWVEYPNFFSSVHLTAGKHTIYVKLFSSTRAYGNTPNITFSLNIQPAPANKDIKTVSKPMLPTAVKDGTYGTHLAGSVGSIGIINVAGALLRDVHVKSTNSNIVVSSDMFTLVPGQSIDLPFTIAIGTNRTFPMPSCPIIGSMCAYVGSTCQEEIDINIGCVPLGHAFVFTFEDYDGSAQYASAIPPTAPSGNSPVLLGLHGAGVDADSPAWTGAFNKQPDAWILLPTGRKPWGYDWHGPSQLNSFGALHALESLPGLDSRRHGEYAIDSKRVLYAGHSMGGGGTWLYASHYPDLALGAAPAAGFIALERYVPMATRVGAAHVDKIMRGMVESAIAEYDTDVYAYNMVGVPLLARYGALDDNVPPWNSRRNVRIMRELGSSLTEPQITEIPNEHHWWNGVMDDAQIQAFFTKNLASPLPEFPKEFTAVTVNPGSSGPRGSIQILQLHVPFRKASVHVVKDTPDTWTIETSNVRRFGFVQDARGPRRDFVDGETGQRMQVAGNYYPKVHFCALNRGDPWKTCDTEAYLKSGERTPEQYGPAAKVLEKKFVIVYGTQNTALKEKYLSHATIIANDWFLYSGGYAQVFADTELSAVDAEKYNLILLGNVDENAWTAKLQSTFPVKLAADSITIGWKTFKVPGTGVIAIGPWNSERGIAMVVAGVDFSGFELAAKVFPNQSGMTVPDYLVLADSARFTSTGGVVAAGFWDNNWQYSEVSGYIV